MCLIFLRLWECDYDRALFRTFSCILSQRNDGNWIRLFVSDVHRKCSTNRNKYKESLSSVDHQPQVSHTSSHFSHNSLRVI